MAAHTSAMSKLTFRECLQLRSDSEVYGYELPAYLKDKGLEDLIPYIQTRTFGPTLDAEIKSRLEQFQPPDYPDNWSMDVHMDFIESLEAGYPTTLRASILLSGVDLGPIHSGRRLIYDLERALGLPATGNRDKMFHNYSLRYYTERTAELFYPHRQLELAARSGKVEIIPPVIKESHRYHFMRGLFMSGNLTLIERYVDWENSEWLEHGPSNIIEWVFLSRNADTILYVLSKIMIIIDSRSPFMEDINNELIKYLTIRIALIESVRVGSNFLFTTIRQTYCDATFTRFFDSDHGDNHMLRHFYRAAGESGCSAMFTLVDQFLNRKMSKNEKGGKIAYMIGRVLRGTLIPKAEEYLDPFYLCELAKSGFSELFYYYFYSNNDGSASNFETEILSIHDVNIIHLVYDHGFKIQERRARKIAKKHGSRAVVKAIDEIYAKK